MSEVKRSYRGVSADDRRQQRRSLLLEACLDLVGGGGIAAVTAESVSARAKLTKRYFYENFAGRDAVLVAALDEMFVDLIADVRDVIARSDAARRAEMVTEVFVSTMCGDPRRARLYAESQANPALQARREDAIGAFTSLLTAGQEHEPSESAKRQLMTRIVVAGVTDVVTSWIEGSLAADRSSLTAAIVALGRSVG